MVGIVWGLYWDVAYCGERAVFVRGGNRGERDYPPGEGIAERCAGAQVDVERRGDGDGGRTNGSRKCLKDQTMLVTRYCNQHGGHTAAVLRATRPPHANTASAARIGRRSAPRAARSCPCVHAALGRCVLARRSVMRARSCWNTHRVVFQEVGHVVDHVIDHHPAVRLRAVLRHLSEADLAEVRRHAPL